MDRKIWPEIDERLILKVGQGDLLALRQLYDKTAEAVFCYALAVTGGIDSARVITEQTFISVWENAGDFHVEEHDALPWIMAVCDRVATDNVIFNKIEQGDSLFSVEEGNPVAVRMMERLPLRDRKLIVLYGIMGMSIRQAASVSKQFINLVPLTLAEAYFRVSRGSAIRRTPGETARELKREFLSVVPELTSDVIEQCRTRSQVPNRSGRILKSTRLQPLRLAVMMTLIIAVLGVGTVFHLVNENESLVTVTTESGKSLAVNALDRVKVVVKENDDSDTDTSESDMKGSSLTQVMSSVTKEDLDQKNLTSDNNSVLITVQEKNSQRADQLTSETLDTVNAIADEYGISPAVLIQIIREEDMDAAGKEALASTLKDVLEDCADQGIEKLSVQDLTYLYYHRGLDLDDVSLYGEPSEDKYQKGQEKANEIFATFNSDDTWVDIFLTVWNEQLVYQVTVFKEDLQNIFEINAETGDILGVRIVKTEEEEEEISEEVATDEQTPDQAQSSAEKSSGGSSSGNTETSTLDKIKNDVNSSADPSVKISRIIRDATGGKINLNLDLPGSW